MVWWGPNGTGLCTIDSAGDMWPSHSVPCCQVSESLCRVHLSLHDTKKTLGLNSASGSSTQGPPGEGAELTHVGILTSVMRRQV